MMKKLPFLSHLLWVINSSFLIMPPNISLLEWSSRMAENLNLLNPRDYNLTNITALGLRPKISFCASYQLLFSLSTVWLAKTKEDHPNITHFTCTLKSQYEIEIRSGDTKKCFNCLVCFWWFYNLKLQRYLSIFLLSFFLCPWPLLYFLVVYYMSWILQYK